MVRLLIPLLLVGCTQRIEVDGIPCETLEIHSFSKVVIENMTDREAIRENAHNCLVSKYCDEKIPEQCEAIK